MSIAYVAYRAVWRGKWKAAGTLALAAALGACSADELDPRPPADVGFHSAGIPQSALEPESPAQEIDPAPAARPEPAPQVAQAYPQLGNPERTLDDYRADIQAGDAPDSAVPMSEPAPAAQEESAPATAEPDEEISTVPQDEAMTPEFEQPAMSAPVRPVLAAAYPRPLNPAPDYPDFEPERPRAAPMSGDDVACRKLLKKYKVKYVELNPIHDSASCNIDHPIKVSAIGSVEMQPAATLNCEMAATFASWTRNELVPSSRWRYLSGIKTIHQGSAYSCRKIAHSRTMSAHSQGNALDVMAITLNNGKKIDIKKQGLFAFRARGLLNTVRSDGCQYFTTVLGPGYNYDHRNHFHFDLMQRKSGRVACH